MKKIFLILCMMILVSMFSVCFADVVPPDRIGYGTRATATPTTARGGYGTRATATPTTGRGGYGTRATSTPTATPTLIRNGVVTRATATPTQSNSYNTRPSSNGSADRSNSITAINVTMPEPKVGIKMIKESEVKIDNEGVELQAATWIDGNVFMAEEDSYKEGKYELRFFFNIKSGYGLADNAVVKLNGETMSWINVSDSQYKFEKTYNVKELQEISYVYVQIAKPSVGNPLPTSFKTKASDSKDWVTIDMKNSPESITATWTPADEKAKAETKYTLKVTYNVGTNCTLSKDFVAKVNDEKATHAGFAGQLMVSYDFVTDKIPEEKKWAVKVNVAVDEPVIGKAPATKVQLSDDSKGYKVTKVAWDPADKKFEAGKEYTAIIFLALEDGYDLRSDYFGLVNDEEAEMPIDYVKDNFYVQYTFPKLGDSNTKVEKVTWATASKWALDELAKANNAGLIPTIFDKEDLTKNITRKEFAHVAVKLWEKVSGKTVAAGPKSPFTDTEDPEVLKAYNLEITKGTSATTFEPDTLITREQMATMMTRALSKAGIDVAIDLNKVSKFADDNEMSTWAKDSVYFMSNIDIIKGIGDNKFGVKGNATREQSLLISSRSAEKFAK